MILNFFKKKYIYIKLKAESRSVVASAFNFSTWRQSQVYLCEFENSQGYKEKLCLRTTTTNKQRERKKTT